MSVSELVDVLNSPLKAITWTNDEIKLSLSVKVLLQILKLPLSKAWTIRLFKRI